MNFVRAAAAAAIASRPPEKPWSVAIFKEHRAALTSWADNNLVPLIQNNICRRILVHAPVKSGKREIAEYTALLDRIPGAPKRVHAFISAWHRVADDEQRIELGDHNIKVFSINKTSKVSECNQWIEQQIALGHEIVVHLDECDHGTGTYQTLGKVWREIRSKSEITTILYSATPEEVLFSGEIDEDFENMMDEMQDIGFKLKYEPVLYNPSISLTSGFCGPAAFLDAGLVYEAMPFFKKNGSRSELTTQGREIVSALKSNAAINPNRNILVLRLAYSNGKGDRLENKAIHQFLKDIHHMKELEGCLIIADKDEKTGNLRGQFRKDRIEWSDRLYWDLMTPGRPIILVLDQTSTRSTEWACHDRIFAVHDFRNSLQFGTISQAQERVNHYANKYGGFQPIKVYGSLKTFQLSAGQISYQEYLNNEWTRRKIDHRRTGGAELYLVRQTSNNQLHQRCPEGGVTLEVAEDILQEVGCYADASLSARVRGKIRQRAKTVPSWHPCTNDTFSAMIATAAFRERVGDYVPRNPFSDAHMENGLYQGNLRRYAVFDYDTIKDERWGFNADNTAPRLTVCYKDGELGVLLRTLDGFEVVDTLTTVGSMYRSE